MSGSPAYDGWFTADPAAFLAVAEERLGARVCLYTDQANPTSNGIYQAIRYQPVVDQVNLRISAGGGDS